MSSRYATEIAATRELVGIVKHALRMDEYFTDAQARLIREASLEALVGIWADADQEATHDLDGRRLMTEQDVEKEAER